MRVDYEAPSPRNPSRCTVCRETRNPCSCMRHDDHVDALGFALDAFRKRKRPMKLWITLAVGAGLAAFAAVWHHVTEPTPAQNWKIEIDNDTCVALCVKAGLGGVFPDFHQATDECSRTIGTEATCIVRVKQ